MQTGMQLVLDYPYWSNEARLFQIILFSLQLEQVVFEHDILSCSSYGSLVCGLCGPKETTDCSEAQHVRFIICWTRSRLFLL
ncbi:hypothetical protein A2U01_0033897, partial [Trifolium medium]|nr:hypothetical protein [Trifolium medium]